MTRREHDAATRAVLGRYRHPIERCAYRQARGYDDMGAPDLLAIRQRHLDTMRALGGRWSAVPALHPVIDRERWVRLWVARDRRECPERPDWQREPYARRLAQGDVFDFFRREEKR